MSVLSDNYKRIVSELEAKITNPEDLEFVKEKISELSVVFMDIIENITDKADQKMKKIEEKQRLIEAKIEEVQNSVDEIESDIYVEEDGNFDFEIVCPYCNNEFVTEIDGKSEITCPECNNVIELDWNDDEEEGCSGHCSSCHGCSDDFEDDEEENEDDM